MTGLPFDNFVASVVQLVLHIIFLHCLIGCTHPFYVHTSQRVGILGICLPFSKIFVVFNNFLALLILKNDDFDSFISHCDVFSCRVEFDSCEWWYLFRVFSNWVLYSWTSAWIYSLGSTDYILSHKVGENLFFFFTNLSWIKR